MCQTTEDRQPKEATITSDISEIVTITVLVNIYECSKDTSTVLDIQACYKSGRTWEKIETKKNFMRHDITARLVVPVVLLRTNKNLRHR